MQIGKNMPLALVTILLALWLIGEVTDHTFGGLVHILFLAALAIFGISLIVEKRRVSDKPNREQGFFSN